MTKLLIADDHPFIVAGLQSILRETDFEIIATLSRGDTVLDEISRLRPDIVVLDMQMPGRTGLEVLRVLRNRGDMRPVVLLTASLNDSAILDALALGVQGIVLKEGAHALLIDCLEAVRAGRKWIDQSVLQRALELSDNGGRRSPLARLTEREKAIVGLVAQGRRNREVASELGMSEGTVKVYLHRVYAKLGVDTRTELAILVRDQG